MLGICSTLVAETGKEDITRFEERDRLFLASPPDHYQFLAGFGFTMFLCASRIGDLASSFEDSSRSRRSRLPHHTIRLRFSLCDSRKYRRSRVLRVGSCPSSLPFRCTQPLCQPATFQLTLRSSTRQTPPTEGTPGKRRGKLVFAQYGASARHSTPTCLEQSPFSSSKVLKRCPF